MVDNILFIYLSMKKIHNILSKFPCFLSFQILINKIVKILLKKHKHNCEIFLEYSLQLNFFSI